MAHCSLAHSGEWGAVATALGDLATLTALDLPSHGSSGEWTQAMGDYHRVATDVAIALAERLAAEAGGPIDLIGHSLGATVLLRLALERPDLVRSLSLVEPVLFAAACGPGNRAPENRIFADVWVTGDRLAAARTFMEVWGAGTAWSDLPARQQRYILDRIHIIPATDPALSDDQAGVLKPGRLEGLRVPVLFIEGGASARVARDVIAVLAARIPGARVLRVEEAGHMVPVTHPAVVADAIRAHLAGAA